MPELVVHHLGLSQSERIVWLCEELALPYRMVRYDREPSGMGPPAYKALHPIGIAPIINDGAIVLAETGAIIDYILVKYGGGRLTLAADHPEFANWLFWLHIANGTLLPTEMMGMMLRRMAPDMAGLMSGRSDAIYDLAEARLAQASLFAGDDFTTADIMMVFPFTTLRIFSPRDLGLFPNIRAYLARIGARPGYRHAMEKCEPGFTPMLA